MRGHHMIPLSLGGTNHRENIISVPGTISKSEHALIHKILNINYDLIRSYRKRTNHLLYTNYVEVTEQKKLHDHYFKNLHLLPAKLIDVHASHMLKLVNRFQADHCVAMHVQGMRGKSSRARFRYFLFSYHESMFIVAKRIEALVFVKK